jgi:hypothetical protein
MRCRTRFHSIVMAAGAWALPGCGGAASGLNQGSDASIDVTIRPPEAESGTNDDASGSDTPGSDGTGSGGAPGPDTGTPGSDGSAPVSDGGASVLEHHNHPSRDGVYVDPILTKAIAATLKIDTTFAPAAVTGDVYAQPLYVEQGPNGQEVFIVVTEENHVTAISGTGAILWDIPDAKTAIGPPVAATNGQWPLGCGTIKPLGISGTPYIDLASRTLYFDAMTRPATNTFKHMIYAVSIDDGTVRPGGWPLDVSATVSGFTSMVQNQRGALQLVNGILYVPYGGHNGDCAPYHGWVIGVPVANPSQAKGWATGLSVGLPTSGRGGIWAVGGVAADSSGSLYVSTGNTSANNGNAFNAPTMWSGGEAVLRLTSGPMFSNQSADYYYPTNWAMLDTNDQDLGGVNPVLFDMPNAPVPHLIAAAGKDGNLYLLNRDKLGGIGGELSIAKVSDGEAKAAPAVYTTSQGTYIAQYVPSGTRVHGCANTGNLGVFKIAPANPPTASLAWCTAESGLASPIVTNTGNGDAIVWDASNRLYGYDADNGTKIFAGGTASDLMPTAIQYFNTPIDAKGRIVVGVTGHLYVFKP